MITKRKIILVSILSLLITFMHVAGWQLSMGMGASMLQSAFFRNIGVLTPLQCTVWALVEFLLLTVVFYALFHLGEKISFTTRRNPFNSKYLWIAAYLFLCAIWYFFLWCCYPGYCNYDTLYQLIQVMYDDVPYNAHHPLLHTLFSGGLITLGYRIDSTDLRLGIFIVNAVQILIVSMCFTYALRYVYIRTRNMILTVSAFCFFAFCPTIVMFAISPTKDVLCYSLLTVGVIQLTNLYRTLEAGNKTTLFNWLFPGIMLTLSCLIRKNIIYAVLVFAFVALLFFRKETKKQMLLYFSIFLLSTLINKGLLVALDAIPGEVDEALCVPYQQIARLYMEKGPEAFTEAEQALLSQVIPLENLGGYNPIFADPVKSNFAPGLDTLLAYKWDYIKFWIKKGIEYPDIYIESLLYNTYQAWYPWTVPGGANVYYFETMWNDENGTPFLPAVYDFFRDISDGSFSSIPVVRMIFSIGTMFWIAVITWFYNLWRKNTSVALPHLLVLLICCTNFLGPVSLVRYYLILFYLLPVYLAETFPVNRQSIAMQNAINESEKELSA